MRRSVMFLAALVLGVTACQAGPAPSRSSRSAAAPPVSVKITITTGNLVFSSQRAAPAMAPSRAGRAATRVATRAATSVLVDNRPDQGISVTVRGGRLSSVMATTASGGRLPGILAAGGTGWRTAWALAPSQAYHVTATAVSPQGRRAAAAGTFHTVRARRTFSAATSLGQGRVYGVGMPIMITFSRPIRDKAEVERSLEIWSSKPVTGAWYWMSGSQVWFRTRKYWPAHTRVRLEAHLRGVRAAPGVYGSRNLSLRFRIGNSLVAVASAARHHMKVWWNGHSKGSWPISTGQPGDDTPDGHYLSFTMGNPVDMNSATYGVMPGDPGYYNVLVYDSVKFTDSGDYVHSAPWSVGEQGYVNVSHGCVNVAPGNAAWYYDHSLLGDPITIVGSPLRGTWGDGWTVWFLGWRKLVAGSGTGQAVAAGPAGSRFTPAHALMPSRDHLRVTAPY